MITNLIDLRQGRAAGAPDTPNVLAFLQAYVAQLVGEVFRFVRVSYGDELTLHFGDLRPARSAKLKGKPYGSYVLGARGSAWMLKMGIEPLMLTAGIDHAEISKIGQAITKEELENKSFIRPESRVVTATPFKVEPKSAFGLQVGFSDGSALLLLPVTDDEPADKDDFPQVADWELLSPRGLLSAGPGVTASFGTEGV